MHDREPTSDFILKRILKNDMQGTPGWRLNRELRGTFTSMLQVIEEREKGHGTHAR